MPNVRRSTWENVVKYAILWWTNWDYFINLTQIGWMNRICFCSFVNWSWISPSFSQNWQVDVLFSHFWDNCESHNYRYTLQWFTFEIQTMQLQKPSFVFMYLKHRINLSRLNRKLKALKKTSNKTFSRRLVWNNISCCSLTSIPKLKNIHQKKKRKSFWFSEIITLTQ